MSTRKSWIYGITLGTLWAFFVIFVAKCEAHGEGCRWTSTHVIRHVNEGSEWFAKINKHHVHEAVHHTNPDLNYAWGYTEQELNDNPTFDCDRTVRQTSPATITTSSAADTSPQPLCPTTKASSYISTPEQVNFESTCIEKRHQHFFWRGQTFFMPRYLPENARTLGDIADMILGEYGDSFSFHNSLYGWREYHNGYSTYPFWLLHHKGFRVNRSERGNLKFVKGCEIENAETIDLNIGDNFIGFYTLPKRYKTIGDLLAHDEIVHVTTQKHDGTFPNTHDTKIRIGVPLMITAKEKLTLRLSQVSGAPGAVRHGKLTLSWGEIKKGVK